MKTEEILNNQNYIPTRAPMGILIGKLEMAEEDIECAHRYLDKLSVPRHMPLGKLSIVGRITKLLEMKTQQFTIDELLKFLDWSSEKYNLQELISQGKFGVIKTIIESYLKDGLK